MARRAGLKRTGRVDGYLVEIRHAGDEWWVSPDQIMRVAVQAKR